jgi:hypothetical protein
MFYRLSHIDDAPLPRQLNIDGVSYLVTHGGLLLDPPRTYESVLLEGHSTLKFFGISTPQEEPRFLASSDESYRRRAEELDISRLDLDRGARFTGSIDEVGVKLHAEGGARFLAPGTRLTFVIAPDEPISAEWSNTFDFGPPSVNAADPALRGDPHVEEAIQQFMAETEPGRLREAHDRLERAWRAAP